MIAAVVAGLLAGYGVAVPVGAVSTYLVGLTARTSWRIGASAALGIASADFVYALLAAFGGAALTPVLRPVLTPLRWLSVVVLLALAIRVAAQAIRQYRAPESASMSGTPPHPARAYFGLLGVTLLNPTTVIYFAALVLGAGQPSTPDYLAQTGFVLAVFAASASWQLLLTTGGALLGHVLTSARARLITGLVSTALVTAFALHLAVTPS